jgi:hypothetical protein
MMFLDCPAYLDEDGARRCGLPAEVRCRFTMRSSDGPAEAATIRCPAGHWFNGPIESLTWDGKNNHDPGTAAAGSRTGRDRLQRGQNAVTVAADPPCELSPPSQSGTSAARTMPRPTIWGGLPACGPPP